MLMFLVQKNVHKEIITLHSKTVWNQDNIPVKFLKKYAISTAPILQKSSQ